METSRRLWVSGSDHSPFNKPPRNCFPSIFRMPAETTPASVYHSIYDDFYWYATFPILISRMVARLR